MATPFLHLDLAEFGVEGSFSQTNQRLPSLFLFVVTELLFHMIEERRSLRRACDAAVSFKEDSGAVPLGKIWLMVMCLIRTPE